MRFADHGELERTKPKSRSPTKYLGRSFNKRKSFSGVQKNNLKFGLNFRGVTNLPPLKESRPEIRRLYKDSRSYNKIFLVRF